MLPIFNKSVKLLSDLDDDSPQEMWDKLNSQFIQYNNLPNYCLKYVTPPLCQDSCRIV